MQICLKIVSIAFFLFRGNLLNPLVFVKIVDLTTTCSSPIPTNLVCFCGQTILLLGFCSTISQFLGKIYFFDQALFLDNIHMYAHLYQHTRISSPFTALATLNVIFLVDLCNSSSPNRHTHPFYTQKHTYTYSLSLWAFITLIFHTVGFER